MGLAVNEIVDERFQIVSEKLRDYITQKKLPNLLVLVYQQDKIVYCEKMGMADIENYELLGCRDLTSIREKGLTVKEKDLGSLFEKITKKIFNRNI